MPKAADFRKRHLGIDNQKTECSLEILELEGRHPNDFIENKQKLHEPKDGQFVITPLETRSLVMYDA